MNGKLIFKVVAGLAAGAASLVGGTYLYKQNHYDKDGYNGFGFDKDGFDRKGYDAEGYNKQGYDADGIHRDTMRDKDGFNRDGYDRDGFDKSGRDRYGYDRDGYSIAGLDKSGYSIARYTERCSEMKSYLQRAEKQMKVEELSYAAQDIRKGLEVGVKCIIEHYDDKSNVSGDLDTDITTCKWKELLPEEFVKKLYRAKNHCNPEQHDSGVYKTHNQIYFSFKVLEELCCEVEKHVCLNEGLNAEETQCE